MSGSKNIYQFYHRSCCTFYESLVQAGIHRSRRVVVCAIDRTNCLILMDMLHYIIRELFLKYQSGANCTRARLILAVFCLVRFAGRGALPLFVDALPFLNS